MGGRVWHQRIFVSRRLIVVPVQADRRPTAWVIGTEKAEDPAFWDKVYQFQKSTCYFLDFSSRLSPDIWNTSGCSGNIYQPQIKWYQRSARGHLKPWSFQFGLVCLYSGLSVFPMTEMLSCQRHLPQENQIMGDFDFLGPFITSTEHSYPNNDFVSAFGGPQINLKNSKVKIRISQIIMILCDITFIVHATIPRVYKQ